MVAVGLWGAFLGTPALWLLPVVFPLVMAIGGVLGIVGVPVSAVEVAFAASAIVLGASVAFAARPPVWLAAIIVAAFAIFHGHAHGTELPQAANPLAYSIGFVLAMGLLHPYTEPLHVLTIMGLGFMLTQQWKASAPDLRING